MIDNEIIKACECCGDVWIDCGGCSRFTSEYPSNIDECRACLITDALSLINRQKAEIDEFQRRNSELDIELKAMRGAANSYKAKVERLQKYDEARDIRLHARLTEKARAEAIKEFATELLQTINRTPARGSFDYEMGYEDGLCKAKGIIRDLVKEMVGDPE